MNIGAYAKSIIGFVALAGSTALGFLPHDDPWFNVLTGVVAVAGTYGIYQVPNKPTPRQQALGAAAGAVVSQLAGFIPTTMAGGPEQRVAQVAAPVKTPAAAEAPPGTAPEALPAPGSTAVAADTASGEPAQAQ